MNADDKREVEKRIEYVLRLIAKSGTWLRHTTSCSAAAERWTRSSIPAICTCGLDAFKEELRRWMPPGVR